MAENPRIEELRRRVQADPASIAFAALAEEFRRVGRYEDAIETCRAGLQRHPAYLSARVTLGRALIETGEYAAAREELETVLRSAPENLAALRGLEQIHERLGHSTELHPELAAIMQQPPMPSALPPRPSPLPVAPPPPPAIRLAEPPPIRLAEAPPLTVPEPAAEPEQTAADLDLSSPPPAAALDESRGFEGLTLDAAALPPADDEQPSEPFDIFGAALKRTSDAAAAPVAPPFAFETGTIAFEAPAAPRALQDDTPRTLPDEAEDDHVEAGTPDAHVVAALARLERFLDAIQTARHA